MSRKAARTVPDTISRLLQGRHLKTPPPAFYPILAHPPPPSLVRSLAPRSRLDLPPSTQSQSPYEAAKAKLDAGLRLTEADQQALRAPSASTSTAPTTRRRPPRAANSKNNKPLPIVFPEDKIRKQFFLDHPFEAYRPVSLVEGESVKEELEPNGADWTELAQRSTKPSAEDAISFIQHLRTQFCIPLSTAYYNGVAQFRTLRAEHETAVRAAALEAEAHGAVWYTEVDRGIELEEKVLSEWVNGREVQQKYASAMPGAASMASLGSGTTSTGSMDMGDVPSAQEPEFSGGLAYTARFASRGSAAAQEL